MAHLKTPTTANITGKAQINIHATGAGRVVRLTDPEVQPQVKRVIADITSSKAKATAFLQEIGVLTRSGKLSRKYGG